MSARRPANTSPWAWACPPSSSPRSRWAARGSSGDRHARPASVPGGAAIGDRIYVAGGFRGDGTTANTLEAYDVGSDSWSTLAPMPEALNHCAAVAFDGRLYVIGGSTALGPPTGATFEYDPARNDWALRSPMARARSAAVAAVVGDRIFVAGGTAERSELEVYDPRADMWTALPEMPTPRNHVAGGTSAGRFHAVGGRPGNLRVMEVFDPAVGA